ncbi:DUF1835 domain-containing protein [Paenibacillus humicus]|uniref:DUF1835 domain-containing protein n=1 Tax=Paenibacillus humicus TaxID=412861 RepID=UPI003D2E41E2
MEDLQSIKKAIDSLGHAELRSYLGFILAEIKRLRDQGGPSEDSITKLVELYDGLMGLQQQRGFWDPVPACTHVHIVIGDSFAGSMKYALKELGWAETHKVITLRENYAIGPLGELDSPEGRAARREWFRDHITDSFEDDVEVEEEYSMLVDKLTRIPEQAKIIVWTSSNACEQAGMRHAVHLLQNKRNTLTVCNACAICEELYNRADARMDYRHSGEIPSDKLQEALRRLEDSSPLSHADLIRLVQEWQAISEQTSTLRIWREGAVLGVPADYYDSYLLDKLDKLKPPAGDHGFVKAARLIGEAIGYCEQYVGDSYFEYRLRELIYNGTLEIKGLPAAMRFYSVRRKQERQIGNLMG